MVIVVVDMCLGVVWHAAWHAADVAEHATQANDLVFKLIDGPTVEGGEVFV